MPRATAGARPHPSSWFRCHCAGGVPAVVCRPALLATRASCTATRQPCRPARQTSSCRVDWKTGASYGRVLRVVSSSPVSS